MVLRSAVILSLTILGILLLTIAMATNQRKAEICLGVGCWVVAAVYAQLTRPQL